VAKTSATGLLRNPHGVGRGEKKYYGVLTPPSGVKTPFFYVSLPIERDIGITGIFDKYHKKLVIYLLFDSTPSLRQY
jgi:hypothetical protein